MPLMRFVRQFFFIFSKLDGSASGCGIWLWSFCITIESRLDVITWIFRQKQIPRWWNVEKRHLLWHLSLKRQSLSRWPLKYPSLPIFHTSLLRFFFGKYIMAGFCGVPRESGRNCLFELDIFVQATLIFLHSIRFI